MNLILNDDYLAEYPEQNTCTIRSGHSTSIRFNRKGDYLASGRVDGTVVIWDMETNGIARKLRGHSKNITSLSWSTCGRYLLSACMGWRAILWDLQDGSRCKEARFRAPIYSAELHPCNHLQCAVALFEEHPYLVDFSGSIAEMYLLPSVQKQIVPDMEVDEAMKEKQAKKDAQQTTTAMIYTLSGKHIIAGTNKGRLNLIDSETREIFYSDKVSSGVITTLRLNENGNLLLINSQDKIIKTFHLPDLDDPKMDPNTLQLPLQNKFQEKVNRLSWNHVAFSCNATHVIASTFNSHELYIWEQEHASLVHMLRGNRDSKEEQGVIEWHPHQPLIAACGLETGKINIWSVTNPQRWSALAPDFVEVEENVEYIEREDEFDIRPQEEIHQRMLDQEDEDVDVLMSGGDDADEFRMPILFDLGKSDSEDEFVLASIGTLRRKSPGDQDDSDATGEERAPSKKRVRGRGKKK